MTLTLKDAQTNVDERISQHPHGYWPLEKIMDKMQEEKDEIKEALEIYKNNPTEENLKKLKTEMGDILFAIVCLANTEKISLEECFNLMMDKNKERATRNYQK